MLTADKALELLERSRLAQLGFFVVAFAVATLVAKAFGAGWGVAASFGQMAFLAAVVLVLMTDRR